MIEKQMCVSPLQYMPWLSRVCLQTAQWCFFLKFLSLKECEATFSNYLCKHTHKDLKIIQQQINFPKCIYIWIGYIWQEISPKIYANHKHDINENWANMSTRPQSWWYEEDNSLTHTLEVMNEVYVCIGEEYCDDRSVFDELSRYCGRQLDALTITE